MSAGGACFDGPPDQLSSVFRKTFEKISPLHLPFPNAKTIDEVELVREVLLMLQGLDTGVFVKRGNAYQIGVAVELTHATCGTVYRVLAQFVPFGSNLLKLQCYCDGVQRDPRASLTSQAFSSALGQLLHRFRSWFETLKSASEGDTLIQLHVTLQDSARVVALLTAAIQQHQQEIQGANSTDAAACASSILNVLLSTAEQCHTRSRWREYGAVIQLWLAAARPFTSWLDQWLLSSAPPCDPHAEFCFTINAQALQGPRSGQHWHCGYMPRGTSPPLLLTPAAAHSALLTGRAVRLLLESPKGPGPRLSLQQILEQMLLPAETYPRLSDISVSTLSNVPAAPAEQTEASAVSFIHNGPSPEDALGGPAILTRPAPLPAIPLLIWLPHERSNLVLPSPAGDLSLCVRLQQAVQAHVRECVMAAPRVPAAALLPLLSALHYALYAPASQPAADLLYTRALEAELTAAPSWQRDCVASWQLMRVADDTLIGRLLEVSFAGVTSDEHLANASLAQLQVCPRVDWPLSILVDRSEAREISDQIATFVFRLHRASWRLRQTLLGRRSTAAVPRVLQLTRLQLLRVLDALTAYVAQRVLPSAWDEFAQRMQMAAGIEQMIEAHQLYLVTIRDRCLLHPRAAIVMNHIQRLVTLALECSDAIAVGLQRALFAGRTTNANQFTATYEQAQQNAQLLVTILARTVQQKTAPHLADLLFRLDLFFESKASSSSV